MKWSGSWPAFKRVRNWCESHWGKSTMLKTLPNGFYLVICLTARDKDWIFNSGPFLMGGKDFFLKDWTPNFNPKTKPIMEVPLWICLYNLSHEYWDEETLREIGNKLGTFVKEDEVILNKDFSMYARICILWQAAHPLPRMVELKSGEGTWRQLLEMEEEVEMCSLCKGVGHPVGECSQWEKGKDSSLNTTNDILFLREAQF